MADKFKKIYYMTLWGRILVFRKYAWNNDNDTHARHACPPAPSYLYVNYMIIYNEVIIFDKCEFRKKNNMIVKVPSFHRILIMMRWFEPFLNFCICPDRDNKEKTNVEAIKKGHHFEYQYACSWCHLLDRKIKEWEFQYLFLLSFILFIYIP